MKRGLKLIHTNAMLRSTTGPNPGPDEEGIETNPIKITPAPTHRPNPGPDEEGIETLSPQVQPQAVSPRPNPGPDEEEGWRSHD